MTKVAYNMYSYLLFYMSREMMEMDYRGSAKCRKSKAWGHSCHFGKINEEEDKIAISGHLLPSK